MACLLDTNVIKQLIRYQLLNDALNVLNVRRADIKILRETILILKDNQDRLGRPIFTPAELATCRTFCDGLSQIDGRTLDADEMFALTKKHDIRIDGRTVQIDGGERQLFAFTRDLSQFSIWTGDRKSLVALANWPDCQAIHKRICGHVCCLERIMRELVTARGFAAISATVCKGHSSIDKAMAAGDTGCCSALLATEQQLQTDCQGLLVP